MLAHAAIVTVSRRQHCITMSSCEAELIALCDLAIELLHIIEVVAFLGVPTDEAVAVHTDSKSAYDLCHRFTSAQHSRQYLPHGPPCAAGKIAQHSAGSSRRSSSAVGS